MKSGPNNFTPYPKPKRGSATRGRWWAPKSSPVLAQPACKVVAARRGVSNAKPLTMTARSALEVSRPPAKVKRPSGARTRRVRRIKHRLWRGWMGAVW
jgi:hypothetical protein